MIRSFADTRTERLFAGGHVPGVGPVLAKQALKRLLMVHAAEQLSDLAVPPGNPLEALMGDRKGQHSIRINGKYRVVFTWTDAGVEGVDVVDYHRW